MHPGSFDPLLPHDMRGPVIPFHLRWERWLLVALACLLLLITQAQVVNEDDLRKVRLSAHEGPITCIEPMPDGHTLVAGCGRNGGLLFIDTVGWRTVRTLPLDGFKDGPRIRCSADGRLLLLKELWRFTAEGKGDMQGTHLVIEAATGRIVLDAGKAMDAAMSADGTVLAVLDGGTVTLHDLVDGQVMRRLDVTDATNAVALSPDGRTVAVSHRPTEAQLATVPSLRTDKKALKAALKYRQMVSLFDARSGALKRTVPEAYDIIRAMGYTADGERLLVYSSQDPRSGVAPVSGGKVWNLNMVDRPGYVQQIDASGEPLRAGFQSLMNEPFLAVSPDRSMLALSSTEGHNQRKVTLYALDTGETGLLIDLEQKHRYDSGETEQHDGRVAYAWLQDGRLVVGLGGDLGILTP